MNIIRLAAITATCATLLVSCKKDDPKPVDATPPNGRVTVAFSNNIDGQPITPGSMNFTNAAGNRYGVDVLKYYISNFTFVRSDGSEFNYHIHELMDDSKPASLSFTLDSLLNGDYTAVKFQLGVDSLHNHTGNQEGDLNPANGMIWTWDIGYNFFKHEGFFLRTNGDTSQVVFHYGTDNALLNVTVPITTMKMEGKDRKLFLNFNLNDAYTSPNNIDFNNDNIRMSDPADFFWIMSMKQNLADAFTYDKAE